jgi:hypothetical protein
LKHSHPADSFTFIRKSSPSHSLHHFRTEWGQEVDQKNFKSQEKSEDNKKKRLHCPLLIPSKATAAFNVVRQDQQLKVAKKYHRGMHRRDAQKP